MLKNKVIITGDVHHQFRGNWISESEDKFVKDYLDIINRFDYSATLFVTGKLLERRTRFFEQIIDEYDAEIQPHTYSAFSSNIFSLSKKLEKIHIKNTYKKLLINDVKSAVNTFYRAEIDIYSWRTHSYLSNTVIYSALATMIKNDIIFVFDRRNYLKDVFKDFNTISLNINGVKKMLIFLPINIPVDDYVIIGYRKGQKSLLLNYINMFIVSTNLLVNDSANIIVQLHPTISKVIKHITLKYLLKHLKEYNYEHTKIKSLIKEFR